MTMVLNRGSIPIVDLKTHGVGRLHFTIFLNDFSMSFDQFFISVYRFLTEDPLEINDKRRDIVKYLKTFKQTAGYPAFEGGKEFKTIRYASEKELPIPDRSHQEIISPQETGPHIKIGVGLHDCLLSIEDLIVMIEYVLCNTNLQPNDPRKRFMRSIRSMKIIDIKFQSRIPFIPEF